MAPAAGTGGTGINVGIVGKTGSGKTTVAALVALACAARGRRVAAVDTDDPPNLGLSLGLGPGGGARRPAVPRAPARGRGGGGVTVDRLLEGYGVAAPGGVTLLHALRLGEGAGGCGCPGHASARGLLATALAEAFDVAVLDMEAGLGHVGRAEGTLAAVGALLVVADPSRKSLVTAGAMVARARAAGVEVVALVGNRAEAGDGAAFAAAAAAHSTPLAAVIPHSGAVAAADRAGAGVGAAPPPVGAAVEALVAWLLPPSTPTPE